MISVTCSGNDGHNSLGKNNRNALSKFNGRVSLIKRTRKFKQSGNDGHNSLEKNKRNALSKLMGVFHS